MTERVGAREQIALIIIDVGRLLGRRRARIGGQAVARVIGVAVGAHKGLARVINIDRRQVAGGIVAVVDRIACFVGNLREPVRGIVRISVGGAVRLGNEAHHSGRGVGISRRERADFFGENPPKRVIRERDHQLVGICHAEQPAVGIVAGEGRDLVERVLDRLHVALSVVGRGGDVIVEAFGGKHLAMAVVGIGRGTRMRAVRHRFAEQVAVGVIGKGGRTVGLDDLRRQMKRRRPGGGDGSRQRSAGRLRARGLLALGVMDIGRHIAVKVGQASNKAVVVIGEGLVAGAGTSAATDAADRRRFDEIILGGERIGMHVAARVGHRRTAAIGVSDLGKIGAAVVLARGRPPLAVIGPAREQIAALIDDAGEKIRIGGVLIKITACGIIGM
jgi:hypothetical protein